MSQTTNKSLNLLTLTVNFHILIRNQDAICLSFNV